MIVLRILLPFDVSILDCTDSEQDSAMLILDSHHM